jgi:hypothetical protein
MCCLTVCAHRIALIAVAACADAVGVVVATHRARTSAAAAAVADTSPRNADVTGLHGEDDSNELCA